MTQTRQVALQIAFDNSYARLPAQFFARVAPSPVSAPKLIRVNRELAFELNLDADALAGPEGLAVLAGNQIAIGSDPLAMAYAGHQFGNFVPQLGDGRAILLGEVIDRAGVRRDIQLKGAGPTPFSRRGDGRAALGPVLREYILCEAFAALGIPATRALAAVATGEYVLRETPQPGAVFVRVAQSHVRVGTFQFFAARNDTKAIRVLADYVIARHYPEAATAANRYRALLDLIIARQAALMARWMHVGFIHGVMNTDNMSIAGESIDFGPCAFMDSYHPGTVYSSIDQMGRYAYANQPRIAQWNLTRLAESLLSVLDDNQDVAMTCAQDAVNGFGPLYEAAYAAGFLAKLGIQNPQPGDLALGHELLDLMAANSADFTLTMRGLCHAVAGSQGDDRVRALFADPGGFDAWALRWRQRLASDGGDVAHRRAMMLAVNPAFIARNHLVEEVISAAVNSDDFGPFDRLLAVLSSPYSDQPDQARFAAPPRPEQVVLQTFCGT